MTSQQTADSMAQLMRVLCYAGASGASGNDGRDFIVCDAFSCVGGNTLAFARENFSVVALEVPNLKPPTSNLQPPTSNFKPQISNQKSLTATPLPPLSSSSWSLGRPCCCTMSLFATRQAYLSSAQLPSTPLISCATPPTLCSSIHPGPPPFHLTSDCQISLCHPPLPSPSATCIAGCTCVRAPP